MTNPQRIANASPGSAAEYLSGTALPQELIGLLSYPKTLPPKLFYDAAGAALFEEICKLDEYYLTRAEVEILRQRATEIAAFAGPGSALVEYGSGAGEKVRLILDSLKNPIAYVPIDISVEQLERVANEIANDYPDLAVKPLVADYTVSLVLPPLADEVRRVGFFPGSTIGNFTPTEATGFLRRARVVLGHDGRMILGVDRRKAPSVLKSAYDDSKGVTAAFNLNLLSRLNREYDADFDPAAFRHRIEWNDTASRIEMHLESVCDQVVNVAGVRFRFSRGESILTEYSYKYDSQRLERVVAAAGFSLVELFSDSKGQFWVALLEKTRT